MTEQLRMPVKTNKSFDNEKKNNVLKTQNIKENETQYFLNSNNQRFDY